MQRSTKHRCLVFCICFIVFILYIPKVEATRYKFVLFWPKPGAVDSADAEFLKVFRGSLAKLCRDQDAALPADFAVEFEEYLLPENPPFSLLASYANRLRNSSADIVFAGTTSASPLIRSHLASLVAPRPLHWIDPPQLSSLTSVLYQIIRIVQRPDLASGLSPVEEKNKLVIVVGSPYRLSDVEPLVGLFKFGVICFTVNSSDVYETLNQVRDSGVTTILLLASRSDTRWFLDAGLDTSLWSPEYQWILYDSALIFDVKSNLMSANSKNITSIEFGPYDETEFELLNTIEDVMLYDLLGIWTAYLGNMTCNAPVNNTTYVGLTGQFNLSSDQTFVRHDWQMQIYTNLLSDSVAIGNFSTVGRFAMSVQKLRFNNRESILNDYRKINLTVLVIPGSQYVRFKEGLENRTDLPLKQRLEGLSFDLCLEVLANLGLKNFTVYIQEDLVYGAQDAEGAWNGLIGALIGGVADLACVDLTPTSARMEVVDFSLPYFSTNLSILYKQNTKDATKEMFQFMFPFNTATWFYLLAAMVALAIVLAILHRISPNSQLFDLRYSMFFSFASLVQGIVGNIPDRPSGRIVVCAYWLFVLIMLVSYVSNYAAMRTLARLNVDITTVSSLLDQSTYTYGTLSNSSLSSVFADSTFNEMRRIFQSMRRFPNGLFTDPKVAEEAVKLGNFAAVLDTPTNMYLKQLICDSIVTGNFDNTDTSFGLPRRSDLKLVIDEELLKLMTNGRVDQLYNKYFQVPLSSRPKCTANPLAGAIPTEPVDLEPRSGALTLHNTLGLLVVNIVGCCLTLIAATFEYLFNMRKMHNEKDQKSVQLRRRSVITDLFSRQSTV